MRELQVRYDERLEKIVLRTRSFEGIEVEYSDIEEMSIRDARALGKSILECAAKAEDAARIKLNDGKIMTVSSARALRDELNRVLEKYGNGK